MASPSPPLNFSLFVPPTPAPSLTCLIEEMTTAFPSCLGEGLWCVGEVQAQRLVTRAYPGLQAPTAGRIP